jgi:hypothetical protein
LSSSFNHTTERLIMSSKPTPNLESNEAVKPTAENEASSIYRIPEWLLAKVRASPDVLDALRNPAI